MYDPWYYGRNPADDSALLSDLAKAIDGEYSAIACYGRLASIAPGTREKDRILEIREDEIRHYRLFSQIYYRLSGRQHSPQLSEECPSEYRAGLNFAFHDEQETVDFYYRIAERASDPAIKESFRGAAADEQNHAVWFLHLMTVQPQ